jgi:hypothetical protein
VAAASRQAERISVAVRQIADSVRWAPLLLVPEWLVPPSSLSAADAAGLPAAGREPGPDLAKVAAGALSVTFERMNSDFPLARMCKRESRVSVSMSSLRSSIKLKMPQWHSTPRERRNPLLIAEHLVVVDLQGCHPQRAAGSVGRECF